MNNRTKALIKLIAGIVGFYFSYQYAVVEFNDKANQVSGSRGNIGMLIAFAAPGFLGLVGLLELVTGLPLMTLAGKWDDLKGWQRGVIGLLAITIPILGLFLYMIFPMLMGEG